MEKRSKVILAAAALMLAACVFAAGVGRMEYVAADLAKRTATVAWTWTDLADNAVRLSLTRNGEDFPTAGWGGTLFIGDGTLGCAIAGTPSGYNELLFDVGRENVPTNGKYAVQILATNTARRVEEWVRGTLTVRANPAADGMPTNWSAYADIARKVAPYIDAQGILSDPANADALWGAVSNRTDELIQAVSPTPDFTTNNTELVETIETTAPAPGNYSVVSNRAMNASGNFLAVDGPFLWESEKAIKLDNGYIEFDNTATGGSVLNITYQDVIFGYSNSAYWQDIIDAANAHAEGLNATSADLSAAAVAATNYTDEAIANIYIPDPDLSEYAKLYTVEAVSNKVETTTAIVNSWESYWGATNVELQVTNFYGNTTGALPRLRIREFRDGHWTNVWDEVDKFLVCKAEILHDVAQSNETVLAAVKAKYAPKAWGAYTDKGTTNVIPNSVYMSSPETYFGGGTEFQRVAVGSGAVSVLVDRGALAKTTGEPGTFRFQDAGGTNYFGFVKSDSYTIGCRTDGISVGAGNAITLRYDVIMSGEDVPVVYWKQQLESATPWAQLNNPDGTAADGAPYAVTWLQDGGSYYATVNCGGSPSGFFVAETSVAGDVVWETNMKARLGGGIECTNTATHVNGVIRAKYNGSTVTWEWSAR